MMESIGMHPAFAWSFETFGQELVEQSALQGSPRVHTGKEGEWRPR